ncbi:helix-turn-helix domain-containing protein [Amycolatopsis sp. NPDC051371]|uniref:helix-turn-helix domain-containing protein n=1 Tax=Amycolatopsis sp. NPDC051371 TaxID=3155800 RepID=UPI003432F740
MSGHPRIRVAGCSTYLRMRRCQHRPLRRGTERGRRLRAELALILSQASPADLLAVRRSSVSEVGGALAEAGCIHCSRGIITVIDRDRLEANACACYRVIRDATDAALPPRR